MATVVLCDAQSPFRDAIERALEAAGHRVRTVTDAAALFDGVRGAGRSADCVLVDETAAGGTAGLFSTAVRLRGAGERTGGAASAPPPPILAVISRTEPEARAAALQVVDDVLSRPAHLVEVVARLEALLRGRAGAAAAAGDRGIEDSATGLRSRAFFDERIIEEWRRATRFSEPLALLVVSLESGSRKAPAADRALRDVGAALRRALRQIDVLGRFGTHEVAALLVNTHLAGALTCAERLRKELAAPLEVAMGLSFFPGKDVSSSVDLVRTAERALERARNEGAGSICLIQHQGYLFQGT